MAGYMYKTSNSKNKDKKKNKKVAKKPTRSRRA
jgi:hypothetical protein